MAEIENRLEELERRALELQPEMGRAATLAQQIVRLKRAGEELAARTSQLETEGLDNAIAAMEADLDLIRHDLSPTIEPPLVDVRWQTPAAPGREPLKRSLGSIKTIVIEHSATLENATPERLAATQLEQGKPAISCHFLVGQEGAIYWTQPLEAAVIHTLDAELNRESVAVCLAGTFNSEPPGLIQLEAAATLLAWLAGTFGLDVAAIRGRREIESVSSPGAQWMSGANYKESLLALVRERLGGRRGGGAFLGAPGSFAPQGVIQVPRPQIVDVVSSLPRHPTLAPYPNRSKPPSVIAIHHTATPKTVTVQQIAQYHAYGVSRDAQGRVLKAQWPGIGYHFVIAANGTIYQTQREQTRSYHVGGNANDACIGVSFIGCFMRNGTNGKPQPATDQIPTPEQLRSGGHLVAWLMQKFNIPLSKVMGHRNVVGGYTSCPGEHWEALLKWKNMLLNEVQADLDAAKECEGNQPIEHYVLFWDHGTTWASEDWGNAQNYIAHFRPTTGFSVQDAFQARNVTIVGGTQGVSAADEGRLRAACAHVRRLGGITAAATKEMLDELVTKDTPWPGAPPRGSKTSTGTGPAEVGWTDEPIPDEFGPDEWSVPDDWEQHLLPPWDDAVLEGISSEGEATR